MASSSRALLADARRLLAAVEGRLDEAQILGGQWSDADVDRTLVAACVRHTPREVSVEWPSIQPVIFKSDLRHPLELPQGRGQRALSCSRAEPRRCDTFQPAGFELVKPVRIELADYSLVNGFCNLWNCTSTTWTAAQLPP